MLSIKDLTYTIGTRTLIENGNADIMDGWKVGVVGINGAGKSTLFKLISGELPLDRGTIMLSSGQRMGIVRQDIPESDKPLIDIVLEADEELTRLNGLTETEPDPNKLGDIYMRLAELDAYTAPARAAILLTGLGFKDEEIYQPFSSFSGGWRMRVALAAALFVQPDLLLLDEPTNHLDLEAIMWLESYLANYPHTLLIISHDRDILNKCIDHVLHIDQQQITMYTGDYDTFERERAAKLNLQQKMHEKQQAERARIQGFIDRFKAQASKARQAQSRMKALERMDIVDAIIASRSVRFNFPQPDKLSPPMISLRHVSVGYTAGQPVLRHLHENIDPGDRIALLGANGNGKSTLIKLIADKLSPMDGEVVRSKKLRIGYFSQHQTEELDVEESPYQALSRMVLQTTGEAREPAVRAKLGQFGFCRDLADNKIGNLSGGEKARLLFAFMSYDAPHMLLLDEPTNHLDVDAREALIQALNHYEGAVIMVSHDPSMVERVADRLWLVKDGTCQHFDGDLEDYRKFVIQSRRDDKKKDSKNNKKAKAEKKNKTAGRISPKDLEKSVAKAEKTVADLEAEKQKLEDLLADPEIYDDLDKATKTQQKYARVTKDLEKQEKSWLEALAELEDAC
ncbi:MAG: ABC-F family ATP-binding cassette domain-containing protein [Pseudomonadota bacterium]